MSVWSPAAVSALIKGDRDNFMVATTPGGIEAQEKQGQTDFVATAILPLDLNRSCTWEQLAQIGIIKGELVDDIFVRVTLPPGWSKRPTDHSMWSELLDEQQRVRASIFYKAAFYDRSAHLNLAPRYQCHMDWVIPDDYPSGRYYAVQDCHTVIWRTADQAAHNEYAKQEKLRAEALAWLTEHYPDWQNPLAYW